MEITIWTLAILLMLVGFVGSFVPLLPGTTFILLGVLLQKWLLPATLSWGAVGLIAVFWFLSVLSDLGCTMLGARLFGGSKWGLAGASGGAVVGMFFSLPALLLGTMLGAVLAEKCFARRTDQDALRAGAGAALGFMLSTFARLGCALVMLGAYAVAAFHLLRPAA
jgi:uncharacterized protein YqgC (DUF456 family)